ncbi:MAG: hypothetical protein Kow0063_11150 [Anaerolineae bacterium]
MPGRVALIRGDDRYQNLSKALNAIADQVHLRGVERILVKPNFVSPDHPLCATHVDATRAVLDWLRARCDAPIVIGEGTALKSTWDAFENYGYLSLPDEYRDVSLLDLNADESVEVTAFDWRLRPMPLRASRTALESPFRISVGPPKTHDTVLVTLSLKNMIMGGLQSWASASPGGGSGNGRGPAGAGVIGILKRVYRAMPERLRYNAPLERIKMFGWSHFGPSSKRAMHQSFPVMNLNLFTLAPYFYPHLAIIDGFEAMEGDGPTWGDRVEWRLALASTDWLAADVTAARLMGFDLDEVGYLYYCAQAGYGASDPAAIDLVGNVRPDEVARRFKRHASSHLQRRWESPAVSRLARQALARGG